jgi:glucans biosynthesis protein
MFAQSIAMRSWIRAAGAVVAALAMVLALVAPEAAAQGAARAKKKKPAFAFEDLAKRAEKLARSQYKDPRGEVPDWLLQISYDQWRDIRFKPEASCGAAELELRSAVLPRGTLLRPHRRIHEIDSQGVRNFDFTPTSSITARTTSRAAFHRTSATPVSASTTRSSRPATRTR